MERLFDILVCPACHGGLERGEETLSCSNPHCDAQPRRWPIINGRPVLLDESRTLFRIADFLATPETGSGGSSNMRRLLSRLWHTRPGLSRNIAAAANYRQLAALLKKKSAPLVLVLGCGEEGEGMAVLRETPAITLIGADVRWTGSVDLICDGMGLPFADGVFDAVILQGVLEHVLDPFQVERQVYRTLKKRGLIYCEYPFLQPNHGGAHDFNRFTSVGHRRFWHRFDLIDAGVCCGPGMALAQVIQQFARSLLPFRRGRILTDFLADWLFWWLKYLDPWLVHHPAALDGASAFYFLGRKSEKTASERQVLNSYRGGQ